MDKRTTQIQNSKEQNGWTFHLIIWLILSFFFIFNSFEFAFASRGDQKFARGIYANFVPSGQQYDKSNLIIPKGSEENKTNQNLEQNQNLKNFIKTKKEEPGRLPRPSRLAKRRSFLA